MQSLTLSLCGSMVFFLSFLPFFFFFDLLFAVRAIVHSQIAVELGSTSPSEWSGDLLVVGVFEDLLSIPDDKDSDAVASFNHADLTQLDESLGGVLTSLLTPKFKGRP